MTRRALLAMPLLAQAVRPKFVVIQADAHRYDFFGAMGHPWLKTPNLDRMRSEGTVFRNAFATSLNGAAARTATLTGQYAHGRTRVEGLPAYPALLKPEISGCSYERLENLRYPFEPAERDKGKYQDLEVPFPASMEYDSSRPEWVTKRRASRMGVDGFYDREQTLAEGYRNYCRSLASLDERVGELLEENTIVVYTSDGGYLWGEQGLVDQRAMYEAALRVPMIFWGPGLIPAGKTVDGLALDIDVVPTLLDYAKMAPSRLMHGTSLKPLIEGGGDGREGFLFEYEWDAEEPHTPAFTGLRTPKYSYATAHGVWDVDELYDMERDPEQRRNLLAGIKVRTRKGTLTAQIEDVSLRRTVEEMRERMRRILRATGGEPGVV